MLLRSGSIIAFFSALLGAVVALDEFLLLFLRQDSGEGLLPALLRNLDFFGLALRALVFALLGTGAAFVLAALARRRWERALDETLSDLASIGWIVLVPVGLTLASMLSLAISPLYPFGLGLATSLSLEGSFKLLLTAGLFAAALLSSVPPPSVRLGFRGQGLAIVFLALLVFTLATPRDFYRDGAGQGNMFKYLRMASAMARSGSLDIEKAGASPEATFRGFLSHVPRLLDRYASESRALLGRVVRSALRGEVYLGELNASRANRSMFRSAEGEIFYINAPGPGLLLVPAFLVDRSLNRAFGWEGQVAAILFWQLLAALLVLQIFLAASALAGERAGLTAAFGAAVTVPLLFYSFQIYPELPAALLLLYAFRKLVVEPHPSKAAALGSGIALALLPWLHQKYSVVALVLGLLGIESFVHRRVGRFAMEPGKIALLVLPLLLSAYSVFLYNHALTGSLLPTATFAAAERTSFAPSGIARGFLGLFFDRENGIFVFAPFYLLALAGYPFFAERHPSLKGPFFLAIGSYLLVIASFPYWPGAVSTMGRYVSSILPLLLLPAAFAIERAFRDGVAAGVAISLFAASLAMSLSFAKDLVPSWQPQLLWDRALYCDPVQYLPSFVSEGILGSGPAHLPKLLGQLLFVGLLIWLLSERRLERLSSFPRRAAIGAGAVLVLACGLGALLERFPGNETRARKPAFRETRDLPSVGELGVFGEHGFEGEGVWVPGGGKTKFLLLRKEPISDLPVFFSNGPEANVVEVEERESPPAMFELPPEGPHRRTVLLRKPYRFEGPRGDRFLYAFTVRSRESFVPAESGKSGDRRRLGTYVRVGG